MRNLHASNLSNGNWNINHSILQGISISCNWHETINTLMPLLTTIKENWITWQNLSWYNYRSNSSSLRLGPRSLEALLFETQYIKMEKLLEASIDFIAGTTFLQKLLMQSNSIFSILECKNLSFLQDLFTPYMLQ